MGLAATVAGLVLSTAAFAASPQHAARRAPRVDALIQQAAVAATQAAAPNVPVSSAAPAPRFRFRGEGDGLPPRTIDPETLGRAMPVAWREGVPRRSCAMDPLQMRCR